MSFYEYLRKLYIKELYLILGLSIPLAILLAVKLENLWLGSAVIIGCIPTLAELYLLNRKKNITTHKSLVLPRALHFLAYYIIIMSISFVYTPFRFEYLLFIPLGISATAFHPFFGRKLKDVLFAFGLISAIGLFIYEYTTENFTTPLGIENYIMIGYVFMLTVIFIYQANVTNERSKSQHKKDKQDLKHQLAELNKVTKERDELTYKLISDFSRTVVDMDADFELIYKRSDDSITQKMALNGRKNAQQLSHFIDDYTKGRKAAIPAMMVRHVDINDLIVQELNNHYDQLDHHGIHLSFEPYAGDLFYSDKEKIKIIVRNLIQNAIDYADVNKSANALNVRVKAKHNALELIISDNGIGMEKETIPHIFKLFYTTKPNAEGTGLYAVKKAADTLGASINVKSKKGNGTTIKATIPSLLQS